MTAAAKARNRRIGLAFLLVLLLVLVVWIVVLTIAAAIAGRWLEAAVYGAPLLVGTAFVGTMTYLLARDNRRAVAMADASGTASRDDPARSRWVQFCLRQNPQRRAATVIATVHLLTSLGFAVLAALGETWFHWAFAASFAAFSVPAATAAVVRTRERLPDTPVRRSRSPRTLS